MITGDTALQPLIAMSLPLPTHTSHDRYRLQDERAALKLKRVYFFWIAPDTTSFEWFSDLLHNLEQQVNAIPTPPTSLCATRSCTCSLKCSMLCVLPSELAFSCVTPIVAGHCVCRFHCTFPPTPPPDDRARSQ